MNKEILCWFHFCKSLLTIKHLQNAIFILPFTYKGISCYSGEVLSNPFFNTFLEFII